MAKARTKYLVDGVNPEIRHLNEPDLVPLTAEGDHFRSGFSTVSQQIPLEIISEPPFETISPQPTASLLVIEFIYIVLTSGKVAFLQDSTIIRATMTDWIEIIIFNGNLIAVIRLMVLISEVIKFINSTHKKQKNHLTRSHKSIRFAFFAGQDKMKKSPKGHSGFAGYPQRDHRR